MSEDRFVDIETRIAHQEHQIEQLNGVVTDQQMRISRLEDACRSLAERLRQVADEPPGSPSQADDDRPPHY